MLEAAARGRRGLRRVPRGRHLAAGVAGRRADRDRRGSGARIVIVNAEPTPYDDLADLVVREPIGTALPQAGRAP